MNRIAGLETEYGCLCHDLTATVNTVTRVRNWLFADQRYGLADMHQRDWDEPAGNGGFLFNGGRCYVDMGHLEYCTPECLTLRDLLAYDRAGDQLINRALTELGMASGASFVRNNIDHYSGATFGCHENYLVRRSAPLTEANVCSVLTFLTLRLLYTGAGRVGGSPGTEMGQSPHRTGILPVFQISQRADYINNDLFEWVQFNRAIINTRDEPLADGRRFRRLHLLHGDTSVLPVTTALKVGTTALVLDLLELDRLPKLILSDAVLTFHRLSHLVDGPWTVTMADGQVRDAVDLLREYQELARQEFAGRDAETDALLLLWKQTLDALSGNQSALVGRVDWITKRWLFERFIEQEGIEWGDPWMKSQDLEFHVIDPERSLALSLEQSPSPWKLDATYVANAETAPPRDTRAALRSRLMHRLAPLSVRYFVDWETLDVEGMNSLGLANPFEADNTESQAWERALDELKHAAPDTTAKPMP